jgi:hypothetical protein
MAEVFSMPAAPARALWFLAAVIAMLLGLLLLFGYFVVASRTTRYEISTAGLAIRGTLYGRTLPWSSLLPEEARIVDLATTSELQPNLRTNGLGLPGYKAGWFSLRRAGKGLLFLTDRSRVVVVPTRLGYTLLLSASEPERFIQSLRRAAAAR